MNRIESFLHNKRKLASKYKDFFQTSSYKFFTEPKFAKSNYWLNAVICENSDAKFDLLEKSNASDVMMRPAWRPMNTLKMFQNCCRDDLHFTKQLADTLVNLPSWPYEKN